MAFFDFLKKDKPSPVKEEIQTNENIIDEEEWENLLPTLKPISIAFFDSVDMSRKRADEEYAKKYNLRVNPLKGYDIV